MTYTVTQKFVDVQVSNKDLLTLNVCLEDSKRKLVPYLARAVKVSAAWLLAKAVKSCPSGPDKEGLRHDLHTEMLDTFIWLVGLNKKYGASVDIGAKPHVIEAKGKHALIIPLKTGGSGRSYDKGPMPHGHGVFRGARYQVSAFRRAKNGKWYRRATTTAQRKYRDTPGGGRQYSGDFLFMKHVNHPGQKGQFFLVGNADAAGLVLLNEVSKAVQAVAFDENYTAGFALPFGGGD